MMLAPKTSQHALMVQMIIVLPLAIIKVVQAQAQLISSKLYKTPK